MFSSRLEPDRQHFSALFLGPHHFHRFLGGDGERFFQQHIDAGVQRVNGAHRVLAVVRADADGVQLLVLEHFAVVGVAMHAFQPEFLKESLRFPRHNVRARDDLYIVHVQVRLHVVVGDPAGADDADA